MSIIINPMVYLCKVYNIEYNEHIKRNSKTKHFTANEKKCFVFVYKHNEYNVLIYTTKNDKFK